MTKTLPNSTTLPNRFDRFFLVRDRTRSGLNYRLGSWWGDRWPGDARFHLYSHVAHHCHVVRAR